VGGAGGVAFAAGALEELDGFAAGAFASPSAYGSDPESSRADRPARKSPRLLCLICPGSLRQEAVSKFEKICGMYALTRHVLLSQNWQLLDQQLQKIKERLALTKE
jgi:hypothetical protein